MNDDPPLSPADGKDAADAGEPPQRAALALDVVVEEGDWGDAEEAGRLIQHAGAAVAAAGVLMDGMAEACVVLTNGAAVQDLNRQWRGKDKPTNVLSFPALPVHGIESGTRFLGDIVMAAETVAREASEMGIPREHHILHLTVHGLLHLLGYDHETEADADVMEALESKLMASLGVADPHAAPLIATEST